MKEVLNYRYPDPRPQMDWQTYWTVAKVLMLIGAPFVAAFACGIGSLVGMWWGAAGPLVIAALIGWLVVYRSRAKSWRWSGLVSLLFVLLPLILIEPSILVHEQQSRQRSFEQKLRTSLRAVSYKLTCVAVDSEFEYPPDLATLASAEVKQIRSPITVQYIVDLQCNDGQPAFLYLGRGVKAKPFSDLILLIYRVGFDGEFLVCNSKEDAFKLTKSDLELRLAADNEIRKNANYSLVDIPEVIRSLK